MRKISLSSYIFNHLYEAIKDSINLRKKNVPYARLLSELFFQGHLIDALKIFPDNGDLQEIYRNILSASILTNMKLMKKSDIFASNIPLFVRCTYSNYLEDYPIITKMDNPEVIKNFIIQSFKEGKNIRFKDIPNKPSDVFKYSNKRKQKTLVIMKDVQRPSKKRIVEKEVEEVIATIELMPSKTRSGKSPKKVTSVSIIS